jgi:hypothetical protein
MATKIYEVGVAHLVDGTEIELKPLKIKYLREFMEIFEFVKQSENDDQAIAALSECARVCMKQFYPSIDTIEKLEDSIDLPNIYKIIDIAAGIKIKADKDEPVKKQAEESEGSSWEDLDLLKIESEVFLLGIWKDYEELEMSISMPELITTLSARRELDYQEKKFLAAIQGVDLEEDKSKTNAWEEMKARVFSRGQTSNPNDVLSLQGANAAKQGFGIGMGLDYEKI